MRIRLTVLIGLGLSLCSSLQAQTPSIGMQFKVHGLMWDAHEVTVAQVKRFANSTGFISRAEKEGGGYIYEAGWAVKKAGLGVHPLVLPRKTMNPPFISPLMKLKKFASTKESVCRVTPSGSMRLTLSKDLKRLLASIKGNAILTPTGKVHAKAIA